MKGISDGEVRKRIAETIGWVGYDEEQYSRDMATDSLVALFGEMCREVIGEDEPEEVTYFNSIRPVNINKWRNQLRAELRAAIKEMEGEAKTS